MIYSTHWTEKKTIISLNNSIPQHFLCHFLLIMQLLWSFCLAKKWWKKKNSQNCQFYVQKKKMIFQSLLYSMILLRNTLCSSKKTYPSCAKKELFFRNHHLHLTFSLLFLDIYCIINCVFPSLDLIEKQNNWCIKNSRH